MKNVTCEVKERYLLSNWKTRKTSETDVYEKIFLRLSNRIYRDVRIRLVRNI